MIRLENKTRDVVTVPMVSFDGKGRPKFHGQIVIGDAQDAAPYEPGNRDPHLQPDPEVAITDEQWLALTDDGRNLIRHYVDRGDFRVLEGGDLVRA